MNVQGPPERGDGKLSSRTALDRSERRSDGGEGPGNGAGPGVLLREPGGTRRFSSVSVEEVSVRRW